MIKYYSNKGYNTQIHPSFPTNAIKTVYFSHQVYFLPIENTHFFPLLIKRPSAPTLLRGTWLAYGFTSYIVLVSVLFL